MLDQNVHYLLLWWFGYLLTPTKHDYVESISWRRHQMETFSALLVVCAGNSPVTGEFPSQWPVTRSFFSVICARINGWVNNREADDLRRHRAHYDVILMWSHEIIETEWRILLPETKHTAIGSDTGLSPVQSSSPSCYLGQWWVIFTIL